jgi:hypothetical protein
MGRVDLPAGVTILSSELRIPDGAHDLEIRGNGTILRASDDFNDRAMIGCNACRNVNIHGIILEGNRKRVAQHTGLPPYDRAFAQFTTRNGILIENSDTVTIGDVKISEIAGFAVLVSSSKSVTVSRVDVANSGSLNSKGRNNTTGGILFEEGTSLFTAGGCSLTDIAGNGVWTHSLYKSRRNGSGSIKENRFLRIGRDAIQVGHATNVEVSDNTGERIGYPESVVDVEGGAVPVGVDTSGNVDRSTYTHNRFERVNGKCIDLDGFHDGAIIGNTCLDIGHYGIVMNNTNPDMQSRNIRVAENTVDRAKFGGIFVIGTGHTIEHNRFLNLNTAHCNDNVQIACIYVVEEPDMLRSGIYLGRKAERPDPAKDNIVRDNSIQGYGMEKYCVSFAPGISRKQKAIENNRCKP